jgi:hypothetical protein
MAGPQGWPDAPEALPRPVIDSHTHLDVHDRSLHGDAAPDAEELLQWAADVGVPKWCRSAAMSSPLNGRCRSRSSTRRWQWGLRCTPTMPRVPQSKEDVKRSKPRGHGSTNSLVKMWS